MTYQPFSDPNMPREIGYRLKIERIKQGLSVEDLCQKMGTRVQQIEAVESGSEVYFQKNSNSFTWFARLYAKKLGINLPDSVFTGSTSLLQMDANSSQRPPLYLIKNKDAPSE
jgi:transcriptional regulator with XRE-family HTH domain